MCLLGGACNEVNPCAVNGRRSGVAADVASFFQETGLGEVVRDTTRVDAVLRG